VEDERFYQQQQTEEDAQQALDSIMDQVARRMADFDRKNQNQAAAGRVADIDRPQAKTVPAAESGSSVPQAKSNSAAGQPAEKQSGTGNNKTQVAGAPGNSVGNRSAETKSGKQLENSNSIATSVLQSKNAANKSKGSVDKNSNSTAHAQGGKAGEQQRGGRREGEEDYLVKNVENMDSLVSDLNNFLGMNFINPL
jgi:hypothetical protein